MDVFTLGAEQIVSVRIGRSSTKVTAHFLAADDPVMVKAFNRLMRLNRAKVNRRTGNLDYDPGPERVKFFDKTATRIYGLNYTNADGDVDAFSEKVDGWKERLPAQVKVPLVAKLEAQSGYTDPVDDDDDEDDDSES